MAFGTNFAGPVSDRRVKPPSRPICVECMSRVCAHFDAPPAAPPRLNGRECELIVLLSGGLANKEIAAASELSELTVKVYFSRIFDLLGLTSRLELALWGLKHSELLKS